MADYTDNALLASIKALNEVVLPALDPSDPLATEQLRLVAGFLKFLGARLPYVHDRNRFELEHYLALGERLAADARLASAQVSQRLDRAIDDAQALLRSQRASVAEMRSAAAALSAPISGLVRVVADADPALRQRVEQTVLVGSKPWVDMQRAWFVVQGFELHPDELPSLDGALRASSGPLAAARG
jgi:hypothetical protein